MTMLIRVTQMNGVPVLVGIHGIKMIEESTFILKPVDPAAKPDVAKGSPPAPVTTQEVVPPTAAVIEIPVVCSKITFHDDKTLVVKELIEGIMPMAG